MSCSVKWCGKTSKTSNVEKDGITFHRFPHGPKVAAKWTEATRREKWTPKVSSVVCSRHFTDDCFVSCPQTETRRLFNGAVPTLHLPDMPIDASTQTTDPAPKETNLITILPSPKDDVSKLLHRIIHKQSGDIKAKDKNINQLKDKLRWAENNIAKLEATVKEYKNTGIVLRSRELNKSNEDGMDQSDKVMERKSIHIIRL